MSRGNRKASIFDDDEDRHLFLAILRRAMLRYGVKCYAFCLMGNHYHLVLETPRGNLSEMMRYLNGVFAQASNRRHGRTGHLFEGRFCSIVVEADSYLRTLSRYVVLNPVRAGLASSAAAWPWSSYRVTAGLTELRSFTHVDWIDWAFGGRTREEAQLTYRLFINDPDAIGTRMDLRSLTLGSADFHEAVRQTVESRARAMPAAERLSPPSLAELFDKLDPSPARRDELIYHAHVTHGYRLVDISRFLGLHCGTASKAVRRFENARTDEAA